MLMAVELPDGLVIARAGGVKIRNDTEVVGTGLNATHVIPAPLDVGAGVNRHTEQGKPMRQHLAGGAEQSAGKRRAAERGGDTGGIGKSRQGRGRAGTLRQPLWPYRHEA